MECRAAGNRRGRGAAMDSGAQGHVRSKAQWQAQATEHRQWAAQAAAAPAKLGMSRLGARQ